MKTMLSIVLVICSTAAVYAQTNPIPENKHNAAGLYPAAGNRIDAAQVQAVKNRQPAGLNSRVLKNILLDYDGADELENTNMGGSYERFIWDLNTRYAENDTNRFALTWAVARFDTLVDMTTGDMVSYPRTGADLLIDSLQVYCTHENVTGTPDTVSITVYKFGANALGLQVDGQDKITNQVLWDTLIITTTSLTPGPAQLGVLTVYPNLQLLAPDNRFLVGVHFYGDTAQNTFNVLAGYGDRCGGACFAYPSIFDMNTFWRLIAWAGTTNLTGINSVAYNCNQNTVTGEEEECELFPIQNLVINAFITMDSHLAEVTGNVFHDANANCQIDTNETRLPRYLVQINGGNHYATTDAAGNYSVFFANTGTYTLKAIDTHPYIEPLCPANGTRTVQVTRMDTTYGNENFGLQFTLLCPILEVDIATAGLLRPCGGETYNVSYCNNGTAAATNAYAEVQTPPGLTITNSQIPFSGPVGNIYTFNIGNVGIGACGDFSFAVSIDCNAQMGETKCVNVHIYPDSVCTNPSPSWDGSSVAVEGDCINDTVQFTISNGGTGDMQDSLAYTIIENSRQYSAGKFKLASGASQHFAIEANGSTFRLQIDQSTGHPGASHPSATVEACGQNQSGNVSFGFVVLFPQDEEDKFVAVTCDQIRTSYDPNDKTAFPAGIGAEKFILATDEIDYRIRFQNTGNDTAFKIVIRDTLTPLLDVTTVRSGAASHPYDFMIYDNSILEWTFDNILLPDSNIDEPGSHGFVQFRVAQKPGNALGTVIENFADIYFDFNEPVKTNVEFNTIGNVKTILTSVRNFDLQNDIRVYPNPFSDFITVEVAGAPRNSEFGIFDLQGKLLRTYVLPPGDKFVINGLDLAQGMYFYRIAAEGKILGAGKMVK